VLFYEEAIMEWSGICQNPPSQESAVQVSKRQMGQYPDESCERRSADFDIWQSKLCTPTGKSGSYLAPDTKSMRAERGFAKLALLWKSR
jgi:hypothetical protein